MYFWEKTMSGILVVLIIMKVFVFMCDLTWSWEAPVSTVSELLTLPYPPHSWLSWEHKDTSGSFYHFWDFQCHSGNRITRRASAAEVAQGIPMIPIKSHCSGTILAQIEDKPDYESNPTSWNVILRIKYHLIFSPILYFCYKWFHQTMFFKKKSPFSIEDYDYSKLFRFIPHCILTKDWKVRCLISTCLKFKWHIFIRTLKYLKLIHYYKNTDKLKENKAYAIPL